MELITQAILVGLFNLVIFITTISSANILFFHTAATSSHRTAIWPLAEKLAERGHNVTYIFGVNSEKRVGKHPNVEEIAPSKVIEINRDVVADFDINIKLEKRVNEWQKELFDLSLNFCEAFYDSPETKEWLSRPGLHYDMVLIDILFAECAYGLVNKFKSKHIVFSPINMPFMYDAYGTVPQSASIPDAHLGEMFSENIEMTLFEKVLNTIMPLTIRYVTVNNMAKIEPMLKEKLNMPDMPPLVEFEKNASLVFHNSYFVEDYPLPLPPMYVSYSGLRCDPSKPQKPLPQEMENFLADSDGFVYVSFGSSVDVGKMPEWLRTVFFNSFNSFKNLKFLWRWSGDIPEDTPENVLLSPWFPQLDVLRHKKIKAFITQVGKVSSQEALCYNVPLISIPIFGDQEYNANRLIQHGATIKLKIDTLTEVEVVNAVMEVTNNVKYKEAMTKLSNMFLDRPLKPLDNLVYWTEYAIRHDTSMLRSPGINQTWYQRRLLDVYGFILLLAMGVVGVVSFVIVLCGRMLFNKLKISSKQKLN